jgi:hypothetical protein
VASKTQLRRLQQALAELGPDASSEQLYKWICERWPRLPGFSGPPSIGRIRKQLQPGWGPCRTGVRDASWEKRPHNPRLL